MRSARLGLLLACGAAASALALAIAGTLGAFVIFAMTKIVQVRRKPVEVGLHSMVGTQGVVRRDGYVLAHGELWRARAAGDAELRGMKIAPSLGLVFRLFVGIDRPRRITPHPPLLRGARHGAEEFFSNQPPRDRKCLGERLYQADMDIVAIDGETQLVGRTTGAGQAGRYREPGVGDRLGEAVLGRGMPHQATLRSPARTPASAASTRSASVRRVAKSGTSLSHSTRVAIGPVRRSVNS